MKKLRKLLYAATLLFIAASCTKDPENNSDESRRVMIMYSAGYNDLSNALTTDLEDLESAYLPQNTQSSHVLLVFSRNRGSNYAPVLYRVYKNSGGDIVKENIKTWGEQDQATDPAVLKEVLDLAKTMFPAKGYGLVYSSHGTGWLPDKNRTRASLRSIGMDDDYGNKREMELNEFVDAIPYKLDYVVFDACFMGCVEVAWALRNVTEQIVFSPTEIMREGMNYLTLTQNLLQSEPNVFAVAKDYYEQYSNPQTDYTKSNPYATITLVKTSGLGSLATISKELFEKYREVIGSLTGNGIQQYYRYDYPYFYDFEDILVKAGISADEKSRLDSALGACITYKAATPSFMSITISTYSGLSMFLPSSGDSALTSFYKEHIDWNDTTNLVK